MKVIRVVSMISEVLEKKQSELDKLEFCRNFNGFLSGASFGIFGLAEES